MQHETQDADLCIMVCPKFWAELSTPSAADEVSGQSWQLVTDFHDEHDGLTLCEQHS
jgi:hypothetical protein